MSDLRKIISKALAGPRPSPKHRWINTRIESAWDEARQKYVDTYIEGFWYDGPMALAMDTVPIWVAEDYRWVNADGTHPIPTPVGGEATYAAAENTALSVNVGSTTQYRLRVNFAETDGASGTGNEHTVAPLLQYQINTAGWNTVGAATDVRYFTDGSSTDNEVIAAGEHVLSYSSNEPDADGSLTHNNSPLAMTKFWSNDNAEFEYTVDFAGTFNNGDTVTFRMLAPDASTAVTFTNVPTANITVPINSGSGSPSVTKPTSTGSARRIVTGGHYQSVRNGQDYADYLGNFDGGSGHVISDVITLDKGITATVQDVVSGVVVDFLVTSTGQTDPVRIGEVLHQVSTTGSGEFFFVTLRAVNLVTTGTVEITKPTSTGLADMEQAGGPDQSASGNPSITKPTSTGSARRIVTSSGSPSVTKPTSTGSARRIVTSSGSPSITKPTSAGVARRIVTSSGAPSVTKPTSTGVADANAPVQRNASGNPVITKPTSTGSAKFEWAGSGSPTVSKPTSTGSSFLWPRVYLNTVNDFNGSEVEMTVTSASADGTSITFSDTLGAPTGSVWLAVTNQRNGDFAWTPVTVTVSSANELASGNPTITKPTSTGTAKIGWKSSGSPTITKPTSTGVARRIVSASGAPQVAKPTSTGAAQRVYTSSGTAQITKPTSSGAAIRIVTASGGPTITKPTSTGIADANVDTVGPTIVFTSLGA